MLILSADVDDDLVLNPDIPTAPPVLTVTPNDDGTGATAAISGTGPDALNTLTVYRWAGGMNLEAIAELTRTGDGSIDFDLDRGSYWATVTTEVLGAYAAVSSPVYFQLSGGPRGVVFVEVLEGVVAKLQSLDLSPLFTPEMISWKKSGFSFNRAGGNQIVVFPVDETIENRWNSADDIVYPVGIACCVPNGGDRGQGNAADELAVRQTIRQAFRVTPTEGFPIPGVTGGYRIVITPGAVFNPEALLANFDVNAIFLKVYCRENAT